MIKYCSTLLLLFLIISFYSCDNSVEPANQEIADLFQIHLQSWFSNTPVKVSLDHSQIFFDTVTTSSIVVVAAIISPEIHKGTHLLRVTVADSVTNQTTFTVNDTLYIGVNYKQTTSEIVFNFQHYPFPYR